MRILIPILLTALICSSLYSQEPAGAGGTDQPVQNNNAIVIPAGYGEAQWGAYLTDTRDKIAGRIIFTDEKSVIKSRDGDLEYHYGFFYRDPLITGEKIETETAPETEADTPEIKDEGRLFYVSLQFPYLNKDLVYNKIKEKYGDHSSEDIRNNQGAMAWNSEKTIILMWIDQYEDKPYCRRIVYVNKEIASQLNEYHHSIFHKREIDLIRQLNP